MPAPVPTTYRHRLRKKVKRKRNFGALYSAIVLLSLHWATVMYVNSSYLEQFSEKSTIGVLYTVSALLTIGVFLFITQILERTGNYKLSLLLSVLEFFVLLGMAFAPHPLLAIFLFLIHQAIVPLILFNLDVFMEELIGDEENSTGGRRGLYLGIMSFAGAVAPLAGGFLVNNDSLGFAPAYIASALLVLPFIYVIARYFRTFQDGTYHHLAISRTLKSFWGKKDIRNVFFAHFLLHFFFAWMVIYTPLYLATEIGLAWSEIGIILFAGLMAYVFIEYPVGVIADTYFGEKEMMGLGLLIMAVSTSWLAFITTTAILIWIVAMFLTRVGASLLETTTESYFFKHTKGTDANVIGVFRITRPLAYVIGAPLGTLTLLLLPFNFIFFVLGIAMIPGFFFAMALKDTK